MYLFIKVLITLFFIAENNHQGFPNIPNLKDILPKDVSDERKTIKVEDEKQFFRSQHLEKYNAKLPNRLNVRTITNILLCTI